MAERARVFICYKKILQKEEGGQKISQKNTEAEILHYLLSRSPSYDPWVDNAGLVASMVWETEIYSRLLVADVLLVLVGPGTSASEWVRREIALANALGISIVPLGFDLTDDQMSKEVAALSIAELQWAVTRNIHLSSGEALLAEIDKPLQRAVVATRERQRTTLRELLSRNTPAHVRAADSQRAASFHLTSEPKTVRLHVSSGDIIRLRGIDAVVNSENDYMQMARFFESNTVSSVLRRRGSRIKEGRYEDVIQEELNWQLRERSRPVQASEVFPTSTGGPGSELARINKFRVILHVAAVQAVAAERKVVPYKQEHQIEASVRNTLSTLYEVNRLSSVISPEGSDQRLEQERRAAAGDGILRSVVFPLLGTGHGGATAGEVIEPMLRGMLEFYEDAERDDSLLLPSDVYISAYTKDDVEAVKEILGQNLQHLV